MLKLDIQKCLTKLTNSLFFKIESDYKNTLTKTWFISIIIIGFVLIVFRFPPMIDWIISRKDNIEFLKNLETNSQNWKRWLSFITYTSEILLVFLFGGSIYSEWITSSFKKKMIELEQSNDKTKTEELINIKNQTNTLFNESLKLVTTTTKRNTITNALKIGKKALSAYNLFKDKYWKANLYFIINKLVVNFPGGLYGLIAFLIFVILCILKIINEYIEYLI